MSSNTDPFGAFFNYAARKWTRHLSSAPVDFSLDDVLKLVSSTSARQRAWLLESGWIYRPDSLISSMVNGALNFLAAFGNVSMFNQLLDRLALNADGDRKSIANAGRHAIRCRNLGTFRALMNHQSTAMAMQTVEVLRNFIGKWQKVCFHEGDKTEWTKLIAGLFDTLASDIISSPNYLLAKACYGKCMPIIEKLFERAKVDPAFQERLMQPTKGRGPLGEAVWVGNVEILSYLCQHDGMKAHASKRDDDNNPLACCHAHPKVEVIELLLDKFPWLVSERGGNELLIRIIKRGPYELNAVKTAKFLLQHMQATLGLLVDVDKLLAAAAWRGWADMCRMLVVDAHADGQTAVQVSNSGQLELKEHCLKDRPRNREADDGVIAACLSRKVLEASEGAVQAANRLPSGDYKLPFAEGKKTETLHNRGGVVATPGPTVTLAVPAYRVCIPKITYGQPIISPAQVSEKLREANKLRSLEQVCFIKATSRLHAKAQSAALAYISDRDEANRLCQDGAFLDGSWHVARPYVADGSFRHCKNCWGFGHREDHCRSQARCRRCGSTVQHSEEHWLHCIKNEVMKCLNCGGGHCASTKNCPKRKEEIQAATARRRDGPTRFDEAPSSVTPATRSGVASTGAEAGSGPAEDPALHSDEPGPRINTRVRQGETDMEWEQETAATTEQEMEASNAGSS